jgi:hypothetical protein
MLCNQIVFTSFAILRARLLVPLRMFGAGDVF